MGWDSVDRFEGSHIPNSDRVVVGSCGDLMTSPSRVSRCVMMEKTTDPLGEKSIARMSLTCPSRTIAVRPDLKSHTLPIASKPLRTSYQLPRTSERLNEGLTPYKPTHHLPEIQSRKLLCYVPLVAVFLFLLVLYPITAMSHRTKPNPNTSPTDENRFDILELNGLIESVMASRCRDDHQYDDWM